MAYFEFNGNAPQTQEVRQLKQTLITAINLANNIKRQKDQMTYTQMQAQFGVPADLNEAAFDATIDGIVTALNATAIENFISQLGFDV